MVTALSIVKANVNIQGEQLMKSQTVSPHEMATDNQKGDIQATVLGALPGILAQLTKEDAQAIIGAKGDLNASIRRSFEPFIRTKTVQYYTSEMARFYQEVFELQCDFSQLRAPVSVKGFDWLLVVDERVSTQQAFDKCVDRFGASKTGKDSLDTSIKEVRSYGNGTYAIWLRMAKVADQAHRNKSANDIEREGVDGITLRERLLLELWASWKTNCQMDVVFMKKLNSTTLCTGSRYANGDVPSVSYWLCDEKIAVGREDVNHADICLGCREVVALS